MNVTNSFCKFTSFGEGGKKAFWFFDPSLSGLRAALHTHAHTHTSSLSPTVFLEKLLVKPDEFKMDELEAGIPSQRVVVEICLRLLKKEILIVLASLND